MRRVLISALALNTALLSVIAYELSALAQEGERVASTNGDTNGDGERDIADAVHILNWLFLGGPEPVALAETPETSSRLAALEAAVASLQESENGDNTQEAIAVLSTRLDVVEEMQIETTAAIDALEATAGTVTETLRCRPPIPGSQYVDRFVDNLDGTVYDSCTGLTWQQDVDIDGDGEIGRGDRVQFNDAVEIVDPLNASQLGGFSDWRIPEVEELISLGTESGPLSLDSVFRAGYHSAFSYAFLTGSYWSQTFCGPEPARNCTVNLGSGWNVNSEYTTSEHAALIRAVRGP